MFKWMVNGLKGFLCLCNKFAKTTQFCACFYRLSSCVIVFTFVSSLSK